MSRWDEFTTQELEVLEDLLCAATLTRAGAGMLHQITEALVARLEDAGLITETKRAKAGAGA